MCCIDVEKELAMLYQTSGIHDKKRRKKADLSVLFLCLTVEGIEKISVSNRKEETVKCLEKKPII